MKKNALKLQVKGARGFETRSGLFWSGVLYADNIAVCQFENRGDGGCLYMDWRPKMREGFRAEIESALTAMNPTAFEPIDTAIGALWDVAMLAEAA